MASLIINKAKKPKFEAHLTIYDLNNVPLVTGVSQIKWRIPGSLHAEHHGRTPKCPIANHRVEYNYGQVIPVRIGIEKSNYLSECILEFEVLQEFSNSASAAKAGVVGGGVEKTTLGIVKVNLSEYVEESEALLRVSRRASYTGSERGGPPIVDSRPMTASTKTHSRHRSSLSLGGSTIGGDSFLSKSTASGASLQEETTLDASQPLTPATTKSLVPDVEEGVIRRYLMQNSKINSTLKIGILMIQLDGERNYVAPALKTAPVFGGIAGLMSGGGGTGQGITGEPTEAGLADQPLGETASSGVPTTADPSIAGKSRDVYETQDMYRRALAASWASQPGEIPADECIEDIFGGGDGFRSSTAHNAKAKAALGVTSKNQSSSSSPKHHHPPTSTTSHSRWGGGPKSAKKPTSPDSPSDDDLPGNGSATLRPRDLARIKHHIHQATAHFHHSDRDKTTAFPAFKDPINISPGPEQQQQHYQPPTNPGGLQFLHQQHSHRRDVSRERVSRQEERKRSDSLVSLATTLGSGSTDRGRRGDSGFKKAREVDEFEVREDLVAWTMPGGVVS